MKAHKTKLALMGLVLLMLSSQGLAATYTCGVSAGEEYVLSVTKKNTELIKEAHGMEENWEQLVKSIIYYKTETDFTELGAKCKVVVNEVVDGIGAWTIKMTFWEWTTGDFISDDWDTQMTLVKDPAEMQWNTEVLFVGVPVDSYLSNMKYITNYEDIATTSGNTVTVDLGLGLKYVVTYDATTGFMDKFQMTYEGEVEYEISEGASSSGSSDSSSTDDTSGGGIPGYDLLMVIGASAVSMSALVYFIQKRRK